MPSITLTVPADFQLARDACSYGYISLAPNRWDVREHSFSRPLLLHDRICSVRITQPRKHLKVELSRSLRPRELSELNSQICRMLRLDMTTAMVKEFHAIDPRWGKSGRARLVRSPTLFEDVLKTVMSCNVTWAGTVGMSRRMCEVLGEGELENRTFPSPQSIAARRPAFLRTRCRLGYRDERIVQLAKLWKRGSIDETWLHNPATPDAAIHEYLIELPGIGPYAAANIMQLLGRYARLPCDTETVRHGRTVLSFKGNSASVSRQVRQHFAPFGQWQFLSYWLELWSMYEKSRGPAWLWEEENRPP